MTSTRKTITLVGSSDAGFKTGAPRTQLVVEYDNEEGRILHGNLIVAKLYATDDGLLVTTMDEGGKDEGSTA